MKTSEKTTEIFKALFAFAGKAESITKESTNPHFRKKYADLNSILSGIHGPLQAAGLFVIQAPEDGVLITRIVHGKSGEWIETETPLILSRQDSQGLGSAITYARRYAISAALSLSFDEDDDGNKASPQNAPKSAKMSPRTATDKQTKLFLKLCGERVISPEAQPKIDAFTEKVVGGTATAADVSKWIEWLNKQKRK